MSVATVRAPVPQSYQPDPVPEAQRTASAEAPAPAGEPVAAPASDRFQPQTAGPVARPQPDEAERALELRAARRAAQRGALEAAPDWPASGEVQVEAVTSAAGPDPSSISIAGKQIPRRGAELTPLTPEQQKAANGLLAVSLALPPGMGMTDWRSAESARRAVSAPPVTGPDGHPASFGELAIFRVGGFNVPPSAAQVFRIAQHAGKVVVAYQSPGSPEQRKLRPVTEIEGVPVPPALRGKIFAIGDPDNRGMMDYEQASDAFVQQLDAMHQATELLGLDPLTSKATLLGNSEASMDMTITRERLEAAGFPDAVGKLVAISGGFRGEVPEGLKILGGTIARAMEALGPAPDARRMIGAVSDRKRREEIFTPDKERLVDLSVAASIGPAAKLRPKFGLPPFEMRGHNNIRPVMRLAASSTDALQEVLTKPFYAWSPGVLLDAMGNGQTTSDGLVPPELSRFGKSFKLLDRPYDHMGIVEDPAVVDDILRQLGQG